MPMGRHRPLFFSDHASRPRRDIACAAARLRIGMKLASSFKWNRAKG